MTDVYHVGMFFEFNFKVLNVVDIISFLSSKSSATKNYKLVFKYILLPDGTHENVRRKRTDAILKREIDLSKPLVPRARSKTRRMSTILSHIQQQGLGDRTQSHHAMHPVN